MFYRAAVSSDVGTKGLVTISSLVSWMGLVTGGWAAVVVLVVEIVRKGRSPGARVVGMGNARRDGVGRTG